MPKTTIKGAAPQKAAPPKTVYSNPPPPKSRPQTPPHQQLGLDVHLWNRESHAATSVRVVLGGKDAINAHVESNALGVWSVRGIEQGYPLRLLGMSRGEDRS